ncbi:GHKL domain-containing protein [bacterium 1XD21-13]|nr:GHKL domain-containing protein [bacterium 1XD21-13]
MRQGMLILSVFLTGGLRAWLYFLLADHVLEKKALPEERKIFLGAAGAGGMAVLLFWLPVPDYGRMFLEALYLGVCGAWLLGTEVRMSLFLGTFYEIAFSLWQLLLSASLGLWRDSGAFLDGRCPQGQAGAWLTLGALGLVALYGARRQEMSEQERFRLLSLPVLAGFLGIITLSEQKAPFLSEEMLDVWTLLSLVLLMGLLVFHMNRQYRMEQELSRLKAEQAELLERDYQALNQSYGANARLFHDVNRHLEALYRLLSQEHYEEARAYLEDLQAPVRELAETVYTGDEAVDYLLNSRMAAAVREGIILEIKVEFPRRSNLRSADLCAILGNLLDNALEAVRKVAEPEERKAVLTIRRIHQMVVIKVENTFAEDVRDHEGELKTTKTDGGLHGWGLKSVRTAAEKYEGALRTSWEGGWFRAVVTLVYQGAADR